MTGSILGWAIAIFVPWVLLAIISLILGRRAYENEERERYSFLIHFPYELFHGHTSARNGSRVLFYVFCGFDAFACALPLIFYDFHPSLLSIVITLFIFAIIKDIALSAMVSVPAYEFKPHLISFTVYGGTAILQAVVATLFFANRFNASEGLALTFAILVGAMGLALAIAMVNPRLTKWTKLDAVVDQDGNITTSRPRPFPLAFTQWLLILFSSLTTLLTAVGLVAILLQMA